MYDLNKLQRKWNDKQGIYHLPKDEFKKIIAGRIFEFYLGKKIIFLDLNFWINFREAKIPYTKIYETLKSLVTEQQIICVLSSSIIDEMGKMTLEKRLDTARVMDSLHCKTVLNNVKIGLQELVNLKHAMNDEMTIKAFPFTTIVESNPFLSDAEFKKYQAVDDFVYNVFYEDFNNMSVEEYCRKTDSEYPNSSNQFALDFNLTKKSTSNNLSYTELLVSGLESQIATCRKLFNYDLGLPIDIKCSLPFFIKHTPLMYILSAVNAAIAIDRDRAFKGNDFFDMMHSCAAVGYVDFFFTERKFNHLLLSKPIDVTSHFPIKISSDPVEILKLLSEIH